MRGRLALFAELLHRLDDPLAEILLPETVHDHAGDERVLAIHEPSRKAEARRRRVLREGVQRCGRAGLHLLGGLEIRAAHMALRHARLRQLDHHAGGGDRVVEIIRRLARRRGGVGEFFRLGEKAAVVLGEPRLLLRAALVRGDRENLFHILRQRRRLHGGRGRGGEAELPKHMLRPLRIHLLQREDQRDLAPIAQRLWRREHRVMRLPKLRRPRPARLGIPVDRVRHWPRLLLEIRARARKLHRLSVGAHLELREDDISLPAPSRPALWQRVVEQRLDAESGDPAEPRLRRDGVSLLRRIRPAGEQRAVRGLREQHAVLRLEFHRIERLPRHRVHAHRLLPLRLRLGEGRRRDRIRERFLRRMLDRAQPLVLFLLAGREHLHRRRFVVFVGIRGVIQERHRLIVFLRREGIVFVVVALRARHRRAHPRPEGRVHAIDQRLVAELLVVGAALAVRHRVAVKTRRHSLILRRIGQEIAGDLLDGELIERQVAVEGGDHPVAIRPHRPAVVFFKPLRVCIPREIEPRTRPALAIRRRRQQAIDDLFKSIRRDIGEEGIHLRERRRQPGEVERHAPQQHRAIGLRAGFQPIRLQPREHPAVDPVARPRRVLHLRQRAGDGFFVGPMFGLHHRGVVGNRRPAVDPCLQHRDLRRREPLAFRRHLFVVIVAQHTLDRVAVRAFSREEWRRAGVAPGEDVRLAIEPQPALLLLLPVALEAALLKDRPDVPGEIHRILRAHDVGGYEE